MMKKDILTFLLFLLSFSFCIGQNTFKELTFTQFIDSIQNEPTPRAKFENIIIKGYGAREIDTIVIDKSVILENVFSTFIQTFDKIVFNKDLELINSGFFEFTNCQFHGFVKIENNDKNQIGQVQDRRVFPASMPFFFSFENCEFNKMIDLDLDFRIHEGSSYFRISESTIISGANNFWRFNNVGEFALINSQISLDGKILNLDINGSENVEITKNDFNSLRTKFEILEQGNLTLTSNNFFSPLFLEIPNINKHDLINWENLRGNTYSELNYSQYFNSKDLGVMFSDKRDSFYQVWVDSFINHKIINDQEFFIRETAFLGNFRNSYKEGHNREWSNLVYRDMKNLETKRLRSQNFSQWSFENYFQLKINQFLKIFSEYGTNPAKSIIISVYVIFLFAFFYLFFPNSWDENNRHRVMNRMLFFTKYFKRKDGMKEVFEEENRAKLVAYEDFKSFINRSKNEIPPYFLTLSKPIYTISVVNYKIRSKFLSKADILHGKWAELHPKRKAITSFIMAFWLIGILIYDLFVKFFNALMLSINTFSTLGFGEIPIKGIPRYLAILQGFIGWFMLSIFSVSLISQMLN